MQQKTRYHKPASTWIVDFQYILMKYWSLLSEKEQIKKKKLNSRAINLHYDQSPLQSRLVNEG